MYFSVYRDIHVQSLLNRSRKSRAHANHVQAVLDRLTKYLGLQTRTIHEIQSVDLERYICMRLQDTWRGKQLEPSTINNEVRILNTAFRRAGPRGRDKDRRNYGFITKFEDVPWVAEVEEAKRRPVIVTTQQLERFIRASHGVSSPMCVSDKAHFWQCVLVLDLITGLRRGELLQIPRPDDEALLHRMEIRSSSAINKSGYELVYALGEGETGRQVVEMLAKLPTVPGEPILPWKSRKGRPLSAAHFSNTFAKIQRRAGIPENQRVKLKHLRSTMGTKVANGFGDAVAKTALGHSPTTNTIHTNYYNPELADEHRAAANAMAGMALPFLVTESPPEPEPDDHQVIRFPARVG